MLIATVPATASIWEDGDIENGQALFNANCVSCHLVTNEVLAAPGLAGIADRWGSSDEVLVQWIQNPQAAAATGDPYVKSLVDRYVGTYGWMTAQAVSADDIKDIMAYLRLLANPDDDQALLRILLRNVRARGKSVAFDVAKAAVRKDLSKARMRPNFGNAGAVDNAVSAAVVRAEGRSCSSRIPARALAAASRSPRGSPRRASARCRASCPRTSWSERSPGSARTRPSGTTWASSGVMGTSSVHAGVTSRSARWRAIHRTDASSSSGCQPWVSSAVTRSTASAAPRSP